MLETYTALLTETSRNLYRNARDNPLLYTLFTFMTLFSILVIAGLTVFGLNSELTLNLQDVMIGLFFVFLLKTIVDIYKYFVTSEAVAYALSMPFSHWKTIGNIFFVVFWTQLGIWALFSGLYSLLLALAGVNLGYPIEYMQFTLSVILATFLGTVIALHFFSLKKWRLMGVPFIISAYLYYGSIDAMIILIVLSALYCIWSMHHGLDAFLFVRRKKRQQPPPTTMVFSPFRAILTKESIITWRDNLYASYIITAALTGAITGYLTIYGEELFIPEALRENLEHLMPFLYVFIGVYIVSIYTAVFPTLNMFLNEEKTSWILHHLPVAKNIMITGKTGSLVLTFLCSIPYLAYYIAFTGFEYALFALWLLVFTFLAGVILSLPLGARYMGKKSDILVLYSVALLMFLISGVGVALSTVFGRLVGIEPIFYLGSILGELVLLFGAIHVSADILSLRYTKPHRLFTLVKKKLSGLNYMRND